MPRSRDVLVLSTGDGGGVRYVLCHPLAGSASTLLRPLQWRHIRPLPGSRSSRDSSSICSLPLPWGLRALS